MSKLSGTTTFSSGQSSIALASDAETIAGALRTKAVSPGGRLAANPEYDVRAGGIIGDGVVDEGALLNTLLSTITNKTFVIPKGLTIRTTVQITPVTGNRIRAHGAKFVNGRLGNGDRLLEIVGVSDVIIEGLELDGVKADHVAATEHRHNVWMENADDITLIDVYSHDAKGDGFYVGDNNNTANYCQRITLENCEGSANHRNGLSVVSCDGFQCTGGKFYNQGGTNPQAGVDVEPNAAAGVLRNIHFTNTICKDNAGPAFSVALHLATTIQEGIHIVGGSMTGSTDLTGGTPGTAVGRGFSIRNPRGVFISDVEVTDNAADGFYIDDQGSSRDLHVANATIARNGYHGVEVWNVPDVTWDECWFLDNGQATANTYDGLSLMPTSAIVGARVSKCKFNGTQQRYGLRTGTNLSGLWLALNDFGTMGTADTSLADALATRFDLAPSNLVLPSTTEIRWNGSEIRLFRNTTDQLRTASTFIAAKLWSFGELEIDGALNHDGTTVGLFGVTPVTRPTAYTQTYATADKTLGAYTADAESAAYTGAADGEAKLVDINALRVAYENLRAFTEDAVQMLNSVVDDLQALGAVT